MQGFFYPRSVAVVGASPRPGNLGRNILANLELFGFPGPIYLVSPRGGSIGERPIYPSLEELPETPEMAVILTPAATVPGLMEDCGRKGVKRVVIESGGFSELGPQGRELEAKIKAIAQKYDMRFIGPNCIGVLCTQSGVAVPFPILAEATKPGGVSIASQSGGVGLTYLGVCHHSGIGVANFASVGNKLNVNEQDLLAYYLDDPHTKVVLLYLESIVAGRRMCELIQASDKPVVVHKSNIGDLSHNIAQSHTSAMANDDAVVEAALAQCGAIRSHTVSQTVELLKALTMPRAKGKRLAIISRSGGHAVVAADQAHREGCQLPPFPQEYLGAIQEQTRASVIRLQNPLDLGDLFHFQLYREILRGALALPSVDGAVVVHGYRGPEAPASRKFIQAAGELCAQAGKPVAMALLADPGELVEAAKISTLPFFNTAEDAVMALSRCALPVPLPDEELPAGPELDRERVASILATAGPDGSLEPDAALELAQAAGLDLPAFALAQTPEQAADAAASLGSWPVVLKAADANLSHKTDQGGVVLNLRDADQVLAAAQEMSQRLKPRRFLLMAQMSGGQEMILGGKQDPSFGPLVLLGLGGVTAEVLGDFGLGLAPLSPGQAGRMLDQLKSAPLLGGFRGRPPANRGALLRAVVQVGKLLEAFPQILELDLNPILAGPQQALALDARARVRV